MQLPTELVQTDENLKAPTPPENVEVTDAQENLEKSDSNVAITMPQGSQTVPDKIQDMDWNNGRPEASAEPTEPLPAHQTAEVANNEKLRENKGNSEVEAPFEASEEVTTGQAAG